MLRTTLWLSLLISSWAAAADPAPAPPLIVKPDAFQTLISPNCSHCRDEARRRATELRANDRVLCWIRGYSDGGTIPLRFFLNPYRVISDTYGVFVYDPDAGFARGFAPSLDFRFHGWRNGVMVMHHKDGTLYSCLTGVAFDGPRRGDRLKQVPTLMSDWGFWLERYPQVVAYHMFDKYKPVELPTTANPDAHASRSKADPRLPGDELVLGVADGDQARAYPLKQIEQQGLIQEADGGRARVIFWYGPTHTAAAYRPVASPPKKDKGEPRTLSFTLEKTTPATPFVDKETKSHWDIAGRAVDGQLKGWTLEWLDGTQVKWFAWAAEYPTTSTYAPRSASTADKVKAVAGTAEFLRAVPKHFATLQAVDAAHQRVTLLIEGETLPKVWPLTPDAEVKSAGWWGRLDDLHVGDRVWGWFKVDRRKQAVALFMLMDELSEQDLHGSGITIEAVTENKLTLKPIKGPSRIVQTDGQSSAVLRPGARVYVQTATGKARLVLERAELEKQRTAQKQKLRQRWLDAGLPGTVAVLHILSGEMDLILDHEAQRWARSLSRGDAVTIQAEPPIAGIVKGITPWRERTTLRLVVHGFDQADLSVGQRLLVRIPPPSAEVEQSSLPPDLDRPRAKQERIEWLLASMYCPCGIGGNGCTGHVYTLASCNPNGCGMPNKMLADLAEKIDHGMTDRQIFEALLTEHGPDLLRPHLLQ